MSKFFKVLTMSSKSDSHVTNATTRLDAVHYRWAGTWIYRSCSRVSRDNVMTPDAPPFLFASTLRVNEHNISMNNLSSINLLRYSTLHRISVFYSFNYTNRKLDGKNFKTMYLFFYCFLFVWMIYFPKIANCLNPLI